MNSAHESFRYIPAAPALLCAFLLLSCSDGDMVTPPPSGPDTTSHDFVWDITQIGVRHTAIRDIAAIAEDDVWLCGEIHFEDTYTYDSNGVYIKPYDLAHWDGTEWTFQRLRWTGDSKYAFRAVFAMKAFASDDIWFMEPGGVAHWNGEYFETQDIDRNIPEGSMLHLMDGYPGNLYLAGTRGALMHFDCNKTFTRVLVPLLRDINDIHSSNGITMAVMNNWNIQAESETHIILLNGTKAHIWRDSAMVQSMRALWFKDSSKIVLAGPGMQVFEYGVWNEWFSPDNKWAWASSGCENNDIFVVGAFESIKHWNGANWYVYPKISSLSDMVFRRARYIENHCYAIGYDIAGVTYLFHGRRITQ